MIPLSYKHAYAISEIAADKAKRRIPDEVREAIWDIVPAPSEGYAGLKILRRPGGQPGTVNRVLRTGTGQVAYLTNGEPARQTLTRGATGERVELQDQSLATKRSWLRESIEEAIEEYMQDHDPQQVMNDTSSGRQINEMFDQIVDGIDRMFK